MYVVTVEFEVDPGRVADFREAMLKQARDSLAREEACEQFDVCFDPQVPTRVFLYEIYSNEAAFKQHLKSEHFLAFDAKVGGWTVRKTVSVLERASLGE